MRNELLSQNNHFFSYRQGNFFYKNIHPILLGIYFIFKRLTENNFSIVFSDYIIILIIVTAIICMPYIILYNLLSNKKKAAVLTTLLCYFLLFFWTIPNEIKTKLNIHFHVNIYICEIGLFFVLFLIIRYSKGHFHKFTLFLNLFLTGLLITAVITFIARPPIKINNVTHITNNFSSHKEYTSLKDSSNSLRPDIFFIILDSHTSFSSLERYWNYKAPLFYQLQSLGFHISNNSYSIAPLTEVSLSSTLNLSDDKSFKTFSIETLKNRIDNSEFFISLKNKGYEFVNLSVFDFQGKKAFYHFPFSEYNNIYQSFFKSSIFVFCVKHIQSLRLENTIFSIFDSLNNISTKQNAKPRFIYAHIMAPHAPYFIQKNGCFSDLLHKTILKKSMYDKNAYLDQLIGIDLVTLNCIQKILHSSIRNPIIILQGDHGFRYLFNENENEAKLEGISILNAVFFKTKNNIEFSDSIKPSETLRLVLEKI